MTNKIARIQCFFGFNLAILATFFSVSLSSMSQVPVSELEGAIEAASDAEIQPLPMGALIVTQKGSSTVIMSENGRFKVEGKLIDTWSNIEINNVDAARYATDHLDLSGLALKPEALRPLVYGSNADQQVLAFVTPGDPASQTFLASLPELEDEFQFHLVVTPTKTTPHQLAAAMSCPKDDEQALDALISGQDIHLVELDQQCDLRHMNNRLITFALLGLRQLPSVIAPSTLILSGTPKRSWANLLRENTQ